MKTDTIQLWDDIPYAKLQSYILHDSTEFQKGRKRPAVIVCPGGAYLGTSDREAEPVALRLNTKGIHAFVLRYTTYYQEWVSDFMNPPPGSEASKFPQPLLDLAKAILTVRENAADGQQVTLGRGECCFLSTEVAGGFTGVYFGLYATGNGKPGSVPAIFDWFRYVVTELTIPVNQATKPLDTIRQPGQPSRTSRTSRTSRYTWTLTNPSNAISPFSRAVPA